jgi:MerR family transcriptional regulator, heat shock protein HspR
MTKSRPRRQKKYVMISAVAERFDIHPQTLRLYEREGLITPRRSAGNTRLYDEEAVRRLETILFLTRELGVNLAGVEVILGLREQLAQMEEEVDRLLQQVGQQMRDQRLGVRREYALVKLERCLPVVRRASRPSRPSRA